MTEVEKFEREFFMDDAVLESIFLGRRDDAYLVLKIYEGNATVHFRGDFGSRFPQGVLVLKCGRFVFFNVDRLASYPSVDSLASHDRVEKTPDLEELHQSIIGWLFLEESERLGQLGSHASRFHHLLIETVGSRIDLVFENLEIMNSLPGFAPQREAH